MRTKRNLSVFSLLVLCTAFFAFSSPFGGDSFEIYVNNKLVMQQHMYNRDGVKNLYLQASNYNDQLRITYSHCGKTGTGRTIAIKDAQEKTLKEWHFTNIADKGLTCDNSMAVKVKDILSLKTATTGLKLYYFSKELPKGQVLASIVTGNGSYTKVQ